MFMLLNYHSLNYKLIFTVCQEKPAHYVRTAEKERFHLFECTKEKLWLFINKYMMNQFLSFA